MSKLPILALAGAVFAASCASTSSRSGSAGGDRTDDPELVAARTAANPEFATQADALAAGVYERFVPPDSVRPVEPPPMAPPLPSRGEGLDPTTDELLGTLTGKDTYNEDADRAPAAAREGQWTLQLGAFESETGAFVRIRQLAQEFPDLPRWYVREQGVVRVFLGRFEDRGDAADARIRLARSGYPDAFVVPAP